jgi:hypothetical protein
LIAGRGSLLAHHALKRDARKSTKPRTLPFRALRAKYSLQTTKPYPSLSIFCGAPWQAIDNMAVIFMLKSHVINILRAKYSKQRS